MEVLDLERPTLKRSTIVGLPPSGEIVVRPDGASGQSLVCDYLETAENDRPALQKSDRVLVLIPEDPRENGCVLGKIGFYRKPDRKRVVLEAG